MSLTNAIRVRFDMVTFGFAGIGPAYVLVTNLTDSSRIIRFSNSTDANLLISYDGVNDNDFVAANSAVVYDLTANKSTKAGFAEIPQGTTIYVRQEVGAPTLGNLYITYMHVE